MPRQNCCGGKHKILKISDHIHYTVFSKRLYRATPDKRGRRLLQLLIPTVPLYASNICSLPMPTISVDNWGRGKLFLRRLLEAVYWPTIHRDVWEFCKTCVTCQQLKPRIQKLAGPLQSTQVVKPGFMLGLDSMGPFLNSPRQNEHLLVVVDYFSKWVELFPLCKNTSYRHIMIEDIFTR